MLTTAIGALAAWGVLSPVVAFLVGRTAAIREEMGR